jgi:hypothetical protein
MQSHVKSITANTWIVFLFMAVLFCLFNYNLHAQAVSVKAESDTSAILIGEQFHLTLEVAYPTGTRLSWPAIPDTFANFEVVKRTDPDTSAGGPKIIQKQFFVLTSFDSGYHVIPPFTFAATVGGDTSVRFFESKPILITVNTVPIDTTRAIKDIKGQMQVPFSWKELIPYFFGALFLGLIAYLIYYFLKKRKKDVPGPVIMTPEKPAHLIALEELKKLDEKRLWQNGNYKAYYTGLTDIIRKFIDNRWHLTSMEMTTDEILKLEVIAQQNENEYNRLSYLLTIADLVKFAKAIPVVYENEQCMSNAVDFVTVNAQTEQKEVVA